MKTSELIGEARDELAEHWIQGAYRRGNGVCAVGALERVSMRHQEFVTIAQAQAELDRLAHEIYGEDCIQQFNDAHTTRKQDVLDLFDKAIGGLEERGE